MVTRRTQGDGAVSEGAGDVADGGKLSYRVAALTGGGEMIIALENLLTAALREANPDQKKISVEPYPDKIDTFTLRTEAAILVHYAGTEFEAAEESDIVQQIMLSLFQCVIVSRDLRSHAGAYDLMDKNRDAVVGLEFAGGIAFFCVSEELIGRENGVWWYSQTFGVKHVYNSLK